MFVRWNLTVCGATQNSFAISSFESPRARAPRMVSSRSVRPSDFAPDAFLVHPDRGVDVALERLP